MKGQRRPQSVPDAVSQKMDGWAGVLKRQLNTILTVLLLIAAGFLVVRWRMRAAETARQGIANDLNNAAELLNQLRSDTFGAASRNPETGALIYLPPAEIIKRAGFQESEIERSVVDVLNASSVDDRSRARAILIRGDLYWALANLPPLPDSAANAANRLAETPDVLLAKAADAYTEVAGFDHSKLAEEVDGAKLGLADVACNKADWAGARKQLEEVATDASGPSFLVDLAKSQLESLPRLPETHYLVPPSGGPATEPTTSPSTMPTTVPVRAPLIGPFLPESFHPGAGPTSGPATQAATMPGK
jgi:hypothetical protein